MLTITLRTVLKNDGSKKEVIAYGTKKVSKITIEDGRITFLQYSFCDIEAEILKHLILTICTRILISRLAQ